MPERSEVPSELRVFTIIDAPKLPACHIRATRIWLVRRHRHQPGSFRRDDRGTRGHGHRRSTGGRSLRTALPFLRSRHIFSPVAVDGSDGKTDVMPTGPRVAWRERVTAHLSTWSASSHVSEPPLA